MTKDRGLLGKWQKVLADFGDFALQSEDLDAVLTEAAWLVGEAMETRRAKVLEIEPSGQTLLLRAGIGWGAGVVGTVRLPMSERSSETFAIRERRPILCRDIRAEPRFDVPPFMKAAGVVALVNVPIFLPGGRAYGLLQVDDTKPRDFDQDDIEFLRTYATVLGPIVDRLFKLRDLRASEERFRLIVEEAKDYAIFVTDAGGRITDWLPGAANVFGWRAEEIIGRDAEILYVKEDRAAGDAVRELETARREGFAPNVRWHRRADGTRVFVEGSVRSLRDANGVVTGFLKIGQDVTERREWQARQQVLLKELQHRTKNLMGVVRRISDQTLRSSRSLDEFGAKFRERISALARAQGLLSRLREGERLTFGELIESELSALGTYDGQGGQVTLDGPAGVALRSSSVQTLALALHELCTNALKYGALHQPEGRIAIRWELKVEAGQPWLHVDWRETGVAVPAQRAAPTGGGAGRELIERALPYQLGARTTYVMKADGIHCTIALPVAGRAASDGREAREAKEAREEGAND